MSDAIALLRAKQAGYLPDHLSIDWEDVRNGFTRAYIDIAKRHLAPNGYLHAATVVALADTACGYGCIMSPAERCQRLHDAGAQNELHRHDTRRTHYLRGAPRSRWAHDSSLGRRGQKRNDRQDHCPVSLHADAALQAARRSIIRRKRGSSGL